MFSVLFVTWLLLFNQHIVLKTVGLNSQFYDAETDEEVVITTESTILSENTTDIDENNRPDVVFEYEIPPYSKDKKVMDKSKLSSDDIIDLNVGGQRITTFRSTLTAVPNSKLALMFTKATKSKTKANTKQDTIYFFDYNYVQFDYLLDQLRTIKRMPEKPAYELKFMAPNSDVQFDFSYMLLELGLNPDRFLSPLVGTHVNLTVNSLIGWKECYRGNYNSPFNASILTNICKGKRLLVACRSISDRNTLTVAGVGKREDIFRPCIANSYCVTEMKNGTGFYYVANQAWGFEGRSEDSDSTYGIHNHQYYRGTPQGSFYMNPCDSSDQHAEYRLCWSLRSSASRGGGDRCGSSKNIHNTKRWERLIYLAA